MIRKASLVCAVVLAVAALAAGCGQDAALVGGDCAAGLTQCDLRCVDLSSDPANCGACGHACPAGVACVAGVCPNGQDGLDATIDGTLAHDGAVDGAADGTPGDADAAEDGGLTDGATDASDGASDGATDASDGANDGATDASDAGYAPDGAPCHPPYSTVDQCGSCTTSCVPPNDVCRASGGTYVCAQLCTSPLSDCLGTCVDETSDPSNCGACGTVCPSNLCVASKCQGSTPGDVVLIGHDYRRGSPGTAQATVLENAVFIAPTNPLRVLSYERYSDPAAVANAKNIVAARATLLQRTVAYTVSTNDADVPSKLRPTTFDVLVVYDQKTAATGALATLGAGWASTVAAFASGGGTVVVLDGDTGTGEMPQFVTSAGLMQVTSHAPLAPGSPVTVKAPSDVVGVGVLSPYGVWKSSASFTLGSLLNITLVVRAGNGTGNPVVSHRFVP